MTFYTYAYVARQGQWGTWFQYGFSFLLLLALLAVTIQFMRHRFNSKYRNLTIVLALCVLFVLGLRWDEYDSMQQHSISRGKMTHFLQVVASDYRVPLEKLQVNDTQLHSGIILYLDEHFYEVHFTDDFNAYSLQSVQPLSTSFKVVDIRKEVNP